MNTVLSSSGGAAALSISFFMLSLAIAPVSASGAIFDRVVLIRAVERVDGALDGAEPYIFEVCIAGPDIAPSPPPTVQTPPSLNFPSGSVQTLLPSDGDFCLIATYAALADVVADYPNGNYTLSATNVAGDASDSKLVALVAGDLEAYSEIVSPAPGASVPTDAPTPVTWNLVDLGGCNTADPASCVDFFWVYAELDEPGLPPDTLHAELITDPTATSTSVPANTFQAGVGYRIEVENRRGAITTEPTDLLGANVTIYKGTSDTNATTVSGELVGASVPVPARFRGLLVLLLAVAGSALTSRARPRGPRPPDTPAAAGEAT